MSPAELHSIFEELESRVMARLHEEGIPAEAVELQRYADLRFRFQSHALPVAIARHALGDRDLEAAAQDFRNAYGKLYGVRPSDPVQFVNYRVHAVGRVAKYELRPVKAGAAGDPIPRARRAYFAELGGFVETPVYSRDDLAPGFGCEGPAIVEEATSTTVIPPDFGAVIDAFGSVVIRPGS